jgi:hypothetical protein
MKTYIKKTQKRRKNNKPINDEHKKRAKTLFFLAITFTLLPYFLLIIKAIFFNKNLLINIACLLKIFYTFAYSNLFNCIKKIIAVR